MSPAAASARVRLTFSFRGEIFQPCARLDLDRWMRETDGRIEALYDWLADAAGIDRYSYEYEVMVLEPLEFLEPEGLARDFVEDGRLDVEGFARAWHRAHALEIVAPIARRHLGVEDLAREPELAEALIAAWNAGRRG